MTFPSSISSQFVISQVVVQPTSFCNLRCTYCYLSEEERAQKNSIPLAVLQRVAAAIEDVRALSPGGVDLLWHAGEPTAVGVRHFREMILPFESLRQEGHLRHGIQTNGTLLTPKWCELFQEIGMQVGVSIDGPQEFNANRVDIRGHESFSAVMRGVSLLRQSRIPFSAIAVVSTGHLGTNSDVQVVAQRMYEFFKELGCHKVGLNFEEKENHNISRDVPDDERITAFWYYLYQIWKGDRSFDIRELRRAEEWLSALYHNMKIPVRHNLIPTIDHQGNVVVLSPELSGMKAPEYHNFVVGNLMEESISDIIERLPSVTYVKDFLQGAKRCEESCPLFSVCQAGSTACNKYTENGSLVSAETAYCRNSFIRPVRATVSAWQKG